MTLRVDLEALSLDAGLWREVSGVLSTAGSAATRLVAGASELSWAAGETGLIEAYEQARARVERLLREGSTQTELIASTLLDVKAQYEASDERARASLAGLWEPEP